ncbi:MAG: hypothetical protein AB1762_05900 [Gemmatimonadota bacterium]
MYTHRRRFENKIASEEPIGIVISRGASTEEQPRLSAFVWSEAPNETTSSGKTA